MLIYLDFGYPISYHDVIILRKSKLYQNWHQFFVHDDDYFKYLLRDLDYLGEEMFITGIGMCEVGPNVDPNAIRAYNIMHVGYRM